MKYSRVDLSKLLYKDYILLIAEELNRNGFKCNGKKYEVSTTVDGNFVSRFSIGFVLSIKDKKAIDYLKEIGLLNNGRCPLTGLMISHATKISFTSECNSSISFDVSSAWQDEYNAKKNKGCVISPVIIIVGIILGFVNGFDIYANYTIGFGILLAILVVMYGGIRFGNSLNRANLSNKLGINFITLSYILKMESSMNRMSVTDAFFNHNIPFADYFAYMKWRNNVFFD